MILIYDFIKSLYNCFLLFFSAVQHERGPRNSTIRRQVAMYLKETSELNSLYGSTAFHSPYMPGFYTFERLNDGITVSAVDSPTSPLTPIASPLTPTASSPGIICQPTPKVSRILKLNYNVDPSVDKRTGLSHEPTQRFFFMFTS